MLALDGFFGLQGIEQTVTDALTKDVAKKECGYNKTDEQEDAAEQFTCTDQGFFPKRAGRCRPILHAAEFFHGRASLCSAEQRREADVNPNNQGYDHPHQKSL